MGDCIIISEEDHHINNHYDMNLASHSTAILTSSLKSSKPLKHGTCYVFFAPCRFLESKFQAGDLKGSVLTILASTVGVGILSLPYAVNLSGLYQGIVLFILGMCVSLYTCQLLILTAEKTGHLTYESIGNELYGSKMRIFAEVNMIINNYGCAIAYIVLLKDLIPNCLRLYGVTNEIATNSYMWGCLICLVIVYPLSLKKQISALRYTSLLSCIACIYLSIALT
jgi:amino acid permease